VLYRFEDIIFQDGRSLIEIRYGTRNPLDRCLGPGREPQEANSANKGAPSPLVHHAGIHYLKGTKECVELSPLFLLLPGTENPLGYGAGGFTPSFPGQLLYRVARQGNPQLNTIDQGSPNLLPIAAHIIG